MSGAATVPRRMKTNYAPFILISPVMILLLIVIAWPILNAVRASFYYDVRMDPANYRFIGLQNYNQVLHDPLFYSSLRNTIQWVVSAVSAQFLLGLVLAFMLDVSFFGVVFFRSTVLIPWITPSVLVALMWSWIYHGNFGVLNDIMTRMGIIADRIPWLAQINTSLVCQTIAIIWQGTPFFVIMLLAGLQTIPVELYEAGQVDGASAWQRFWYITVPHLLPIMIITVLLRTIWVSNNVEIIYVMTQGGPARSSLTLPVYTFQVAQKALNFGYASALALSFAVMLIALLIVYLGVTNRLRERFSE